MKTNSNALKAEVLTEIDSYLNNTLKPNKTFSKATQYLEGLVSIIKSDGAKNVPEYLLNLKKLLADKNLSILSVYQCVAIYKNWKNNPYLIDQLVYLSDSLKSRSKNDPFMESLLSFSIPNRAHNKTLYLYFYLISRLAKLGVFDNKNQQQIKIMLSSLFDLELSKLEFDGNIGPMERKLSSRYRQLFSWVNKISKAELSNDAQTKLIVRLIVLNYNEINYLEFFVKLQSLNIIGFLEKHFSYEIILFTRQIVLEKLAELYQNAPDFFDKQNFFESGQNDEPNFVINRFFRDYKISEVFLANILWLNKRENAWLHLVLNGISIRKASDLPLSLTKKASHIFTNLNLSNNVGQMRSVPEKYSTVTGALIYSSLLANGVSASFADSVLSNKAIRIDGTNLDFWIKWMSYLYKEGLKCDDIDTVMDYVQYKTFNQGQTLALKGKKIYNLLADVDRWHFEINSDKIMKKSQNQPFIPLEIKDSIFYDDSEKYVIKQILDTKELHLEGKSLQHCVFSYRDYCAELKTAIFSLRKVIERNELERLITIEVRNHTIVQARGKFNRQPTKKEKEIIKLWAEKERLTLGIV